MRKSRHSSLHAVFYVVGRLLIVFGGLFIVPIIMSFFFKEYFIIPDFVYPAVISVFLGLLFVIIFRNEKVYYIQSILICGVAWIILSLVAALPFFTATEKSFIDAFFEGASGLTTAGITIYTNIEDLPRTIIFWRCFIQWIGSLGILTLFLVITFRSNSAYFHLFSAESTKIESSRPTPSIFKTIVILWSIYSFFTILEMIILKMLGVSLFDSICHGLTNISTAGFSSHDESILYFRNAGYKHYKLIEYTIILFMFLGSTSFLLHYRILTGKFKDVFTNYEFKVYIYVIVVSTLLMLIDHFHAFPKDFPKNLEEHFRNIFFTVVTFTSTTGYTTIDINSDYFPTLSKIIIFTLMFIGGCVGSTAGGIKILRAIILYKLFVLQIKKLMLPRKAVAEVVYSNRIFPDAEIKRIVGIFFGWMFFILIGGLITAFFTNLGPFEAISGMLSAVSNIGPCFFSVEQMANLPAIVKLVYIFGMIAGRLEILPLLLVFNPKAWKL